MTASQPRRATIPTIVASTMLVVFSVSGLMAGGITAQLNGGLSLFGKASGAATPSSAVSVPRLATAAPTTAPTSTVDQPFTLELSVTPNPIHAGQQLTAIITAADTYTTAPVAGLPCTLERPENGGTPLLTQWPNAAVTNTSGQASWTIQVPPETPPGNYEVGFAASGAHDYRYHGQVSITVLSNS